MGSWQDGKESPKAGIRGHFTITGSVSPREKADVARNWMPDPRFQASDPSPRNRALGAEDSIADLRKRHLDSLLPEKAYDPSQGWPGSNRAAAGEEAAATAAGRRNGGRSPDGRASDLVLETDAMLSDGDEWEPTGAGRKAWYNPQSSSASDLPSEVLPKPRPASSQRQSPSDGQGWFHRKSAAFRGAQRDALRPTDPPGDQSVSSGDKEQEWASWQKDRPGRAAAAREEETQAGAGQGQRMQDRMSNWDYDVKPVPKGRAKNIQTRYYFFPYLA